MPRVTLFIDSLGAGGAQSQLALLAAGLDRARWQPSVAFYNPHGQFRTFPADVPVERLPRRHRLDPAFARAVFGLLSPHRSDLVHAWLQAPSIYAALARTVPRRTLLGTARVPLVTAIRCSVSLFQSDPKVGAMHLAAAHLGDHTTVNSREIIDWLAARGVDRNSMTFLPNALSPAITHRLASTLAERRAFLAHLGLDPDRPPLTLIGRFDRYKNHDGLLRAVLRLRAAGEALPPVLMVGAPEEPARVAKVREMAAEVGFTDLHVAAPVADVATLVEASRLTVLASHSEGTPNVVLEALGLGGLVVATRVGEVPALVEDGITGLLCEPGDEALAARLRDALHLPEAEVRAIGARARTAMRQRYAIEAIAAQTADLYDDVRARHR